MEQMMEEQEAPEQTAQEPGDENTQRIVLAAMSIIADKKGASGFVKMLSRGDPVQSLVQAAGFLFRTLYDESKGSAPPEAMLAAVPHVLSMLDDLADAAGIKIDDGQEQAATQAVAQMLQQKLSGKPQAQPDTMQPGVQPDTMQPGVIQQAMGA